MHPVAEKLIGRYRLHKRDLPWRNTSDPYRIWISEVILQQTRVAQGMDYYLRFVERFPDVVTLADADEKEVMLLWQGLGYYSRARNLHAAAKTVRDQYGGKFPADYSSVRNLRGIGDYTAAAICSFAFGLGRPAVDGNVSRWIARVFAIGEPVDAAAGKRKIDALAGELMPEGSPGLFNQAAMEFGALQCTPGHPDCGSCPVQTHCAAFAEGAVAQYPKKKEKKPQTRRWFHYLVIRCGDRLLLEKRTGQDIWKNLYQLPLIETEAPQHPGEVMESEIFTEWMEGAERTRPVEVREMAPHVLSHRIIRSVFYEIWVKDFTDKLESRFIPVPVERIGDYPVPKLIENYLTGQGNK